MTDGNVIPMITHAVTTASTHDSKTDLSRVGIPVYMDKGYDATMTKVQGNFKLIIHSILRNKRISGKRDMDDGFETQ